MYRRLEYKHDYFGDVEIAKHSKHYPVVIHAENLSLTLARSHPVFSWSWQKEVPIFSNLNFEIQFGKLFGVVGPDGECLHYHMISKYTHNNVNYS